MTQWKVVCLVGLMVAAAVVAWAADSRTYGKSVELVWDEAVKAARDAELVVTDSNRAEHWFTMETPKKTLQRTVGFEVTLETAGTGARVTVRATDEPGSKKSEKAIAAFFDALEARMR
jgi:hypothetical protein